MTRTVGRQGSAGSRVRGEGVSGEQGQGQGEGASGEQEQGQGKGLRGSKGASDDARL